MSESLRCPHCGRAIPPAMHLYTHIRLRCECGGQLVITKQPSGLVTEAREMPGDATRPALQVKP